MKTLLWKLRTAYWGHRILGIKWTWAWAHAESYVAEGWHLEMSPKEAVEEEADAWAASC